jgi:GT2 family glycosyltransferase
MRSTDADLLIFLDSDCLPQPHWLAQHLLTQAAGHPIVGGGVLPRGNNYWHLAYNLTLFHETLTTAAAGKRDFLPTLNLSVKREVIEAAGPLNESLPRGEDVEWTTRMRQAGYQPYFQPAAAVYHQHNRHTLTAVWADCANSGYHMRQVRLQYARSLSAPPILRYRLLVLLLSPFIAAWITARISTRQPKLFAPYIHLLPAIFITKIAWCWGASRRQEPG